MVRRTLDLAWRSRPEPASSMMTIVATAAERATEQLESPIPAIQGADVL
jgi:hypothetical protein